MKQVLYIAVHSCRAQLGHTFMSKKNKLKGHLMVRMYHGYPIFYSSEGSDLNKIKNET